MPPSQQHRLQYDSCYQLNEMGRVSAEIVRPIVTPRDFWWLRYRKSEGRRFGQDDLDSAQVPSGRQNLETCVNPVLAETGPPRPLGTCTSALPPIA